MSRFVKLRKCRLRFSHEEDTILLEEVFNQNPYETPARWRIVHENFVAKVGKPFTLRSVRDHVDLLTRRYVDNDKQIDSSGLYTGHSNLLGNVVKLRQQFAKSKIIKEPRRGFQNTSFMKQNNSMNSNENTRELIYLKVESPDGESLDGMDMMHEEESYTPAGSDDSAEYIEQEFPEQNILPQDMSTLEYLKLKHMEEMQMKKKELKMEEKKLALKEKEFNLEARKFELQKWERSKRLEIEMKERELHMKILEQQQQLIAMLFEKNNLT